MKIDLDNPTLLYFLKNPQSEHYIRELSLILKRNLKLIVSDIKTLNSLGLIDIKRTANLKKVKLGDNLAVKSLQKFWIIFLLRSSIINANLKGISKIILYGSFANQTYGSKSDLDLFFLTEEGFNFKKIDLSFLNKLEIKIDKELSIIDMSELEFYRKLKNKDKLVTNIDGGIIIYDRINILNEGDFYD